MRTLTLFIYLISFELALIDLTKILRTIVLDTKIVPTFKCISMRLFICLKHYLLLSLLFYYFIRFLLDVFEYNYVGVLSPTKI